MTLNDIKNSLGYNEMKNYKITGTMETLLNDGIFYENGIYYKIFYVTSYGVSTPLKVRILVTGSEPDYTATAYGIEREFNIYDYFTIACKGMGVNPRNEQEIADNYAHFQQAINSSEEQRNRFKELTTNGKLLDDTITGYYDMGNDLQYINAGFLDFIYDFLVSEYPNITNVHEYEQIKREDGLYYIYETGDIKAVTNAFSGNAYDNNLSFAGLDYNGLYNTLDSLLADNDSLDTYTPFIVRSNVIRVAFRPVSPSTCYVKLVGLYLRDNTITVSNDGTTIVGTVDKTYTIDYTINSGALTNTGHRLDANHNTSESFNTDISFESLDINGRNGGTSAKTIYEYVIDSIGYTGTLRPYEVTGTTPINNQPRTTRYPDWEYPTISDDTPDEEPDPPQRRKGVPDPDNPIKFIPPIGVIPPVIIDEPSNLPTYDPDPSSTKGVLGHIYNLESDTSNPETRLGLLGDFLFNPVNLTKLKQIWANRPEEGILKLHYLYINPTSSSNTTKIVLGNVETDINAKIVENRYQTFNCGFRTVERVFNNSLDFKTSISIYLPFSGIHRLSTDEVMGARITVRGCVDVISGDVIYNLTLNRKKPDGSYYTDEKCLYTFTGNCSVDIPFSSNNVGFGNLISCIGNALSGNVGGAVASATSGIMNVNNSGSLTGNVGAMGYKYPYLIIEYPRVTDISNRAKLYGRRASKTVRLSEVNGYAVFDAIHIDTIGNASDQEKAMIDNLLKSGVIL